MLRWNCSSSADMAGRRDEEKGLAPVEKNSDYMAALKECQWEIGSFAVGEPTVSTRHERDCWHSCHDDDCGSSTSPEPC